jgi:heme exporter protein B
MLALGRTFGNDYQDGTLEQLLLTPQPLFLIVLAKVLAQWIVSELAAGFGRAGAGMQFGLSPKYALDNDSLSCCWDSGV